MTMFIFLLLSPFILPLCAATETTASLRFVADTISHDSRAGFHKSSTSPGIITTVAGGGSETNGVAATSRIIDSPQDLAFDKEGNFYIAAYYDHRIYKVTASGIITTVAGTGSQSYGGDGGQATSAILNCPAGIVFDTTGDIFIADSGNGRIRKITMSTGLITTVAGDGKKDAGKDNIAATSSTLLMPSDVAVDPYGNIFIAETTTARIRKVTASTGIITTIAGSDIKGISAVATKYYLYRPTGVTLDTAGNVYFAGGGDPCIFKITVSTGGISIVAGTGSFLSGGKLDYNVDDILATEANLKYPNKVVFDASGNMYISDSGNRRIRKVTASTGIITTVAGTGEVTSSDSNPKDGEGGLATAASISYPTGVAIDSSGNLYFADDKFGVVRKVTFNGATPSISATSPPSVKGTPSSPSAPVASTPTASAPTPGASSSSSKAPTAPSSTATQSSSTTHFVQTLHLTIILLISVLILHFCRDA